MHRIIWELTKAIGALNRRINRIEEEKEILMTQVEDLTTALNGLIADIGTKFGEIQTEVTAIEQKQSEGTEPDLSALKTLVGQADSTVKGFTLPAETEPAPTGSTEAPTGGTPAAPPEGSAPQATLPKRSVYTHTDNEPVDETQWPQAPFSTEEDTPRQLYYNVNDAEGQVPFTTAGAGAAGWEVWSGNVKAQD